jgi:DNA-binding response OmpR family regulator
MKPLAGHRILIFDQEWIVAHDLAVTFEKAGAQVIVASQVDEAVEIVRATKLTGAVLDTGKTGSECNCVEAHLRLQGVPIILHSCDAVPARDGIVVVVKPISADAIVAEMIRLARDAPAKPNTSFNGAGRDPRSA